MGRITIFSLDDCPHCLRTKAALNERQIPFTEISLSKYPHRRKDMLQLSDKLSVPQVFLNSTPVGGADEAIKMLQQWDAMEISVLEVYECFCGKVPDPSDPRLRPATEPPIEERPPPPREEQNSIALPDGTTKVSVLHMTELLKSIVPRKELSYNMTKYKNSFVASTLINALAKNYGITPEQAEAFGVELQTKYKLLDHVVSDHVFKNTDNLFFRLQCDQTPRILNSYRIWTERVDPDAMALLKRLKKLLGKIESAMTDKEGKVNYKAASSHEFYPEFEEGVCELQGVEYEHLPYETKLVGSHRGANGTARFGVLNTPKNNYCVFLFLVYSGFFDQFVQYDDQICLYESGNRNHGY